VVEARGLSIRRALIDGRWRSDALPVGGVTAVMILLQQVADCSDAPLDCSFGEVAEAEGELRGWVAPLER
jgi:hypothetical protein